MNGPEFEAATGEAVPDATLAMAELMVETFVGRSVASVKASDDVAWLKRAVIFQARYIEDNDYTTQAALVSIKQSESSMTLRADLFAPYMAPWAIRACAALSWRRAMRTIPVVSPYDVPLPALQWATD